LFRVRSPAFIDRDTCGRRPRDTASRAPTGWRQFCHCLRQVSWTDARRWAEQRRQRDLGAAEAAKVRMGGEHEPVGLMDKDDSFAREGKIRCKSSWELPPFLFLHEK
jgi:hypothetical protein